MPETQELPTDKEMLVMLRQRLALVEATVLDLIAVYEHTGVTRQRSMQALLDRMRQTFQEAVIADPDMTDAQRAHWLALPHGDDGDETRSSRRSPIRPVWEQWGGMVGVTDRMLARARSDFWARTASGYPTPDEDIIRLLDLLENRRIAGQERFVRLALLLGQVRSCETCHGGLHDNDLCPHWGPVQQALDDAVTALGPATAGGH